MAKCSNSRVALLWKDIEERRLTTSKPLHEENVSPLYGNEPWVQFPSERGGPICQPTHCLPILTWQLWKWVILYSYSRCSLILTRPLGSYPKYQFHRGLGAFHPRGANRSTSIETQSSPNEESSSTTSNTTIKAILQWVATLSSVRDCTTKSINRPFILPK